MENINQLYTMLSHANQAIVRSSGQDILIAEICRIGVEHGGFKMAWIGFVQEGDNKVYPAASYGIGTDFLDHIHISTDAALPEGQGPTGAAIRTNSPSICNDCSNDPSLLPWRDEMAQRGLLAWAAFPLQMDGATVGALNLHAVEPRFFTQGWIGLLNQIAVDISFAMDRYVMNARRAAAEGTLRETEQRLQGILASLDDGVWSITPDGTQLLYLNPGSEKIYQRPVDDFFRNTNLWLESLHPDDKQRALAAYEAMLETGKLDLEYRILRPNGEVRWLHDRGYAVHNGEGVPVRLDGIATDITERVHADKQQRLAAQVFENAAEAIMITDGDNNIVSVNAAFTRITGYEASDVIGKNPRLLRSERHDAAFYQELWDTLNATGHWQGEIWDKRKNGEEYPKWLAITVVLGERDVVANYIAIFADITERKEAEGKIQYLAHFDSLTGLPNRALLQDRLKQALAAASRHKKQLSLLFLDLDHFKNINDSLGHDVGDLLLQAVAERLQGCVREGDTVSRLGGDEFVVVLLDIQKSDNAAYVAQKIVDELAAPFSLGEHVLYVTSSIGISLFPEDGRNSDMLIRNADSAMYSAKTGGRNDYRFFTQDMNEQALARLALEIDLRQALALGEFRLHYQPQISSETGKVIGMEALIRWQHPVRGMVSPASFIPLAEELGLIVSIGDWVLREACRQNRAWQVQGLPPVPIAVNLSALQFLQQNLPDKIQAILEETGLEPRYLELELTESTFMQDAEQTITMLQTLKAMGLQLAIDDFGTGYSSLSYLKRFPIDKLKIDQSFVRHLASDPDDAAIARTIISMGHSLRLEVIAEGVETAEQLVFLETEGCDQIQGYYFSKPLAADEFSAFCCNNMDR